MITMIGCAKGGLSPYYSVRIDENQQLLYICRDGERLPITPLLPHEFPLASNIVSALAFGVDFDGVLTEIRRRVERQHQTGGKES